MEERKIVLITGTSSGFGKEAAMLLQKNGYRVFGTSRKPVREKEFEMLKLDVDSDASVLSCISALMKRTNRIDVLINNAGYISSGALEECSVQDAKSQFETNFFGAVRMVNAVLPTMRRQESGQIINIGSIAGIIPSPFMGFYSTTKAALISYSEILRQEVRPFNIKVSIVEPGFFNTGLFRSAKAASKHINDYRDIKSRALSSFENDTRGGGDPKRVAETILKIIQAKNPRLHYPVGKEKGYLFVKKIVPDSVFEKALVSHWKLDGD